MQTLRLVRTAMVTLWILATIAAARADGPATQPASPLRIACVGDSITEGFTLPHPDNDAYPAQLGRLLGDHYKVENFGAGGCTLLRHGDRPYVTDHRHFYERATAFDANVVVIMLGTNDSTPVNFAHVVDFEADLGALVDHFREGAAHPTVYLCIPPPAFTGAYHIVDANLEKVAPIIRIVAEKQHVKLIDVRAAMANDKSAFTDGIHPNLTGAKKLAEVVEKAMTP